MYFSTGTRINESCYIRRLELKRWLFWEACLYGRAISHACHFTRVSSGTLSVSNSSLLWTKAWAWKTIPTVTLFVLLITYAHIWERIDTLSVPCHRTRARAFTFFPAFPWRVTFYHMGLSSLILGQQWLEYSRNKGKSVEVVELMSRNYSHELRIQSLISSRRYRINSRNKILYSGKSSTPWKLSIARFWNS